MADYLEMAKKLMHQAERENFIDEINLSFVISSDYPLSPEREAVMQNRRVAYDEALIHLESHLEENPDSIEALNIVAHIHVTNALHFSIDDNVKLASFQEAARYTDRGLDIFVREGTYTLSKDLLETFKDLPQAEKEEMANFDGLRLGLIFKSAYTHKKIGDHMAEGSDERMEQYQISLDRYHDIIHAVVLGHQGIYPLIKKAHLNYANIAYENGRPDLAFKTVERLVGYSTIIPGLTNPNDISGIVQKLSDYDEAVRQMQQER